MASNISGGKVTVEIIQGRNLVAMDHSMFGKASSDPYVKVYNSRGDKLGKTQVVNKNLSPTWNWKDEFTLGPGLCSEIHFEVYDHDKVGESDPMGAASVTLSDIPENTRVQMWLPLGKSKRGGKFSGDIEVAITFVPKKPPQLVILQKGQEFVPEEVPTTVCVGLGWDCYGPKVDLDASAVFFDSSGGVAGSIFFGNSSAFDGAAVHLGDSRTGEETVGEGDDEQIILHLHRLPQNVVAVMFVVTAYSDGCSFSDVETAKFHMYDQGNRFEMCRFPVSSAGKHTSLIMCRIARVKGFWVVNAVGEPGPACRDYGYMLPELKEYIRDIVPNVRISESDRMIVMRKGGMFNVADYVEPMEWISMGLSWDITGTSIDLDASCIAMSPSNTLVEIVSFSHLKANDGTIQHSGDNRSGAGEGDDEVIKVNLSKISHDVGYLFFIVNSFSGQQFSSVRNTSCRLFLPHTGREIARFQLSGSQYDCTGLVMAALIRTGSSWVMRAIGEGCTERTARGCVDEVQAYVSRTIL